MDKKIQWRVGRRIGTGRKMDSKGIVGAQIRVVDVRTSSEDRDGRKKTKTNGEMRSYNGSEHGE